MKMTGAIRKQLSAFLEGFYNIIPRRLISIFNEQELELLVSGLPVIDIDDLKANTEYHKYQANSLQIIWFWRALRSFDQTDKAKFMQFVTGSSKVKKMKWKKMSVTQSILTLLWQYTHQNFDRPRLTFCLITKYVT